MLLTEFIGFHASARPDSPMLIQDGHTLTFKQGIEKSRRIAAWLSDKGVGKGDRVAILGENSLDHLLLLLSVSYIGAIFVPLNYRLAAPELADILEDAEAKLLLIGDSAMAPLKAEIQPLLGEGISLIDALGEAEGVAETEPDPSSDENILIQLYTSGTTGKPKGVQLDHQNVEALSISTWVMQNHKPAVGSTDLVVAPLFHIGGLGSLLIPIMAGGAVLLHRQFDPEAVVADIERHSVNKLFMVPAMIQAVLTSIPNIRERNFNSLEQVSYGASPINPSLLSEAMDVFQCEFLQLYGMTETTGAVVALLPEDHDRALAGKPELLKSCGRGLAGVYVKICDSNGNTVPTGETGEIVIRSKTNTCGYWRRPDETEKSIKNGWVYTGDAGIMDEQGYIYIRDRIKDMVVTGGENVYPVEVEKVITGHPAIMEAAVIGVPDEKFGEALLAVCTLNKDYQLSADELIEYCRDKIAGYKIPRQLQLMDALPRNPSGKILKTELREPYWKNQQRQI